MRRKLWKRMRELDAATRSPSEPEVIAGAVLESTPDCYSAVDRNWRVVLVNRACEQLWGRSRRELLGQDFWELFPKELRGTHLESLYRAVMQDRHPRDVSVASVWRPGRYVRVRAFPYKDGIALRVSDITSEHTIEEQHRRAEDQLEQALRLQKLLHRELVHRVANNFQVLSSLLHLQGRNSEVPGVAEELNDAADRIQAMGIIHRKLYADQPELGAPELVSYLRELCHDLASVYAGVSEHAQIVFHGTGEIRVSFDRCIMLAIIVAELVTNAFKYAYAPGTRGEIMVSLQRENEAHVLLTVADRGRGLPENFETTSKGLGMLVARSNARQLGTDLEIDRTPPGVKFSIRLRIDE